LKRKYYFIDTENVGDSWLKLVKKLKKKDRIITFYTENHSKCLEEFLVRQVNNPKIIWLECAVGNNALDYQLLGVLAYMIAKHPKASYCIYSNDKGYQKTVAFWQSRGIQMKQKFPEQKYLDQKKKRDKKQKKKHKQSKKTKAKNQTKLFMQKQSMYLDACDYKGNQTKLTEEQYVFEIAKSIPFSNLNGWYCALTVILGQKSGREWYQKIRRDVLMREDFSKHFTGNSDERCVNIVTLALYAHDLDTDKAKNIYEIIRAHHYKDLNAIKMDFDKIPELKTQTKYYRVLRPLVALLKDL